MTGTPSAQYTLTLRVEIEDRPGMLGKVAGAIGLAGGTIGAVELVLVEGQRMVRDITVETIDKADWPHVRDAVNAIPGAHVLGATDRTLDIHRRGKIEIVGRVPVRTRADLSMAYTPGVARVAEAIVEEPELAFEYTLKRNAVAVVTDGSAVQGLGNIGPRGAIPVMEGKALLLKEFGGVNAFPICLDTQDVDEIVATVKAIAPGFGGIHLEDIAAPRCFEIEERLQAELDIPVFHDDQHGTAVVTLAALHNALAITGRRIEELRIVISGLGAAGIAVTRSLLEAGAVSIVACDSRGAVSVERSDYLDGTMHESKRWVAERTNSERLSGAVREVLDGADLLIGLSSGRLLGAGDIARMAPDAVIFAMANPDPEVTPEDARRHARIVATGRSDYPNQINNVLCFPGLFRGALDHRVRQITEGMKLAAARAIADVVEPRELREDYIIPSVFNRDVAVAVAEAVAREGQLEGLVGARPLSAL